MVIDVKSQKSVFPSRDVYTISCTIRQYEGDCFSKFVLLGSVVIEQEKIISSQGREGREQESIDDAINYLIENNYIAQTTAKNFR